jgi:hypothetical protein
MRSSVSTVQKRSTQIAALGTRSSAPPRRHPKVGVGQDCADHAIGAIIEAIQNIALALDDAAVALMFYLPAKGAEPAEALRKLDHVKERFGRALHLMNLVEHPTSKNSIMRLRAEIEAAEAHRRR